MEPWNVTETNGGVQFKIKVQPRSGKNEISGLQGDALKVRITAPPVDGEANEACIRFIARWLGVPRKGVQILSGLTNPHKILRVEGMTREKLLTYLEEN